MASVSSGGSPRPALPALPFGEDELVPLTKVLVEENQHCIEAGQRSAQMPDITFVVHLQQSATCCGKILRSQS